MSKEKKKSNSLTDKVIKLSSDIRDLKLKIFSLERKAEDLLRESITNGQDK